MDYKIELMKIEDAIMISNWQYLAPFEMYSMDGSDDTLDELMNGNYYSVKNNGNDLMGYYCYDEAAQVPLAHQFGIYVDERLDFGLGLRPDLCGHGNGLDFMMAGLNFGGQQFNLSSSRLTVANFNERAKRLYEKLGFYTIKTFKITNDNSTISFDVMIKD